MLLSCDFIIKIFFLNLPGHQFIIRDRMNLVTPQNFEWPDNTFKRTKLFMLRVLVKSVGSRGPTPTVLYKSGKDTSRCFSILYSTSMWKFWRSPIKWRYLNTISDLVNRNSLLWSVVLASLRRSQHILAKFSAWVKARPIDWYLFRPIPFLVRQYL